MINISYPVRPRQRSLAACRVADTFGLAADEPPTTIARDFFVPVLPGQIALFHGPSGSGKSSLLRAVAREMNAQDANALPLPESALIDALPGTFEERLNLLTACGLGEARLMLRTPDELSEGQRFRFRLALALQLHDCVAVDEFAALLDRPLAKIVAFNVRKRLARTNARLLVATSHEDLIEDLQPDVRIHCRGEGDVEIHHREGGPYPKKSQTRPRSPSVTGAARIGLFSPAGIIGGMVWAL
jgi:ABC-type ATPase with predicted acetyltransferase domain